MKDNFAAGGGFSLYQLVVRKGVSGSVVVDPQGDAVSVLRKCLRQHALRCGIHCNQNITLRHLLCGQTLVEMGIFFRDLRIAKNVGSLAQLPQTSAQQGSAAQGVAVGTAVGEDHEVILFVQELSCLFSRQNLHLYLPQVS